MQVVNVRDYGGIEAAQRAGVRYCGRPSPLGNPCSVPGRACPLCGQVHFDQNRQARTACRSLPCYRRWLWEKIRTRQGAVLDALEALREGDLLGCWCCPEACHCQVIVQAWRWCKEQGLFEPIQ